MSQRAFNYLLFQLGKSNLDEELQGLLSIFEDDLSEEVRETIQTVPHLFNKLRCVLDIDDLTPLKEAFELVEKHDLVAQVEEFEARRREGLRDGTLQQHGKSARIFTSAKWAGEKMLGAVKLHCNFRTVGGGFVVVGTALILGKCDTLEDYMKAFTVAVLPAANTLRVISEGSVCFTVQAENLSALQVLWQRYQDGTLQKNLQDFLVTEEINQLAEGQKVLVNVDIDEQEYKEACIDLMNTETKVGQLSPRRRRNSDSILHGGSSDAGEALSQQIKIELHESEAKGKHSSVHPVEEAEPDRLAYVQRYLEQLQDTHSVTSETTDSGLGAQSTPPVLGIEGDSDICKDLSVEVIRDISVRLQNDEEAWKNVRVALQLTGLEGREAVTLKEVLSFFPATPVRLLQDVFNALRLFDLVELLEKEVKLNHSSLKLQGTLEEVRTLRKTDDRPTTYHSNVAVLIMHEPDVSAEITEGIKTFFLDLNSDNDVTIIIPQSRQKEELRRLREQLKFEARDVLPLRVHRYTRRGDYKLRRRGDDELRKLIEQVEKDLNEIERAEKVQVSETINRWIQNQERFTFFAVFDFIRTSSEFEFTMEKLRTIPNKAKLVVKFNAADWGKLNELPDTLLVSSRGSRETDVLPDAVGKIFNKRWQTLDLCAMMEEMRRCPAKHLQLRRRKLQIDIEDKLSSIVRFKKLEDKDSA